MGKVKFKSWTDIFTITGMVLLSLYIVISIFSLPTLEFSTSFLASIVVAWGLLVVVATRFSEKQRIERIAAKKAEKEALGKE